MHPYEGTPQTPQRLWGERWWENRCPLWLESSPPWPLTGPRIPDHCLKERAQVCVCICICVNICTCVWLCPQLIVLCKVWNGVNVPMLERLGALEWFTEGGRGVGTSVCVCVRAWACMRGRGLNTDMLQNDRWIKKSGAGKAQRHSAWETGVCMCVGACGCVWVCMHACVCVHFTQVYWKCFPSLNTSLWQ